MGLKSKEEEALAAELKKLHRLPANKICFECPTKGTQYVDMHAGTFVCTGCCGVLREFSHRLKSISMTTFSAQEMLIVRNGGNELNEKIWHGKFKGTKPSEDDTAGLRKFLSATYKVKKYYVDPLELAVNASAEPPSKTKGSQAAAPVSLGGFGEQSPQSGETLSRRDRRSRTKSPAATNDMGLFADDSPKAADTSDPFGSFIGAQVQVAPPTTTAINPMDDILGLSHVTPAQPAPMASTDPFGGAANDGFGAFTSGPKETAASSGASAPADAFGSFTSGSNQPKAADPFAAMSTPQAAADPFGAQSTAAPTVDPFGARPSQGAVAAGADPFASTTSSTANNNLFGSFSAPAVATAPLALVPTGSTLTPSGTNTSSTPKVSTVSADTPKVESAPESKSKDIYAALSSLSVSDGAPTMANRPMSLFSEAGYSTSSSGSVFGSTSSLSASGFGETSAGYGGKAPAPASMQHSQQRPLSFAASSNNPFDTPQQGGVQPVTRAQSMQVGTGSNPFGAGPGQSSQPFGGMGTQASFGSLGATGQSQPNAFGAIPGMQAPQLVNSFGNMSVIPQQQQQPNGNMMNGMNGMNGNTMNGMSVNMMNGMNGSYGMNGGTMQTNTNNGVVMPNMTNMNGMGSSGSTNGYDNFAMGQLSTGSAPPSTTQKPAFDAFGDLSPFSNPMKKTTTPASTANASNPFF